MLYCWDRYTADLAKGLNRFRWAEYSLSSSLIISLLFILFGNFDFVQISGVFVINACMCWFGDLHELMNAGRDPSDVDWSSFIYGSFCGVLPWILMFSAIFRIPNFSDIPWFVWIFLLEYLVLFFSFPATMLVQYLQVGKWSNARYPLLKNGGYLAGERTYQKLSLICKSLILW